MNEKEFSEIFNAFDRQVGELYACVAASATAFEGADEPTRVFARKALVPLLVLVRDSIGILVDTIEAPAADPN